MTSEEVLKLHREMDLLKHRVEAQRVQIQNLRRQLQEAEAMRDSLARHKRYIDDIIREDGRYVP